MQLRKATRQKAKLRIGLSAASGFGKTYSALLMAYGITGNWETIAVIDTEHGSAELYSDLGSYNVLPLEAPYSPERYVEAIQACEAAGMEVIIVDSITHEWDGKGGCLEIVDSLGGRYQDWAKVTPRHQKFIDAILQSKAHVITTVRRKQDYSMSTDDRGKVKVEKAGLKEVTRDGFEYELTLNFEIINDRHLAKASKDRTGLYMNKPEFVVTVETGKELREWAEKGLSAVEMAIAELKACEDRTCTVHVYNKYKHLENDEQFKAVLKEMSRKFPKEGQQPAAKVPASIQATPEQREELLQLVENEFITPAEEDEVRFELEALTQLKAVDLIARLKATISEREIQLQGETAQL